MLENRKLSSATDRDRRRTSDIYSGLSHQQASRAHEVPSSVPTLCAMAATNVCPSAVFERMQWVRPGQQVPSHGLTATSSAMSARFPRNSNVRYGRYYGLTFMCDSKFQKEAVDLEMAAYRWRDVFYSTEKQVACVDTISGRKLIRVEEIQFSSDKPSFQKRKNL